MEGLNNDINRVVYIDEVTGELRYKFEASQGVWGSQPVDFSTNAGLYSSLAVDSSGPHISYYDRDITTFKFTEIDNSAPGGCGEYGTNAWFRCDTVADNGSTGSSTSVGVGYNDAPYIAYYNHVHTEINVCRQNPGWTSTIIVDYPEDVGRYASLAFNRENRCGRVAYMDVTSGRLMYARNRPTLPALWS